MTINRKIFMNAAFTALFAVAGCSREQAGDACCEGCKESADSKTSQIPSLKVDLGKTVLNATESIKNLQNDEAYKGTLKKVAATADEAVGRIGDELSLKKQELENAKVSNAAAEVVAALESDIKALSDKYENAAAERSKKMMDFVRQKHMEALQKK